MKRRSTWSRRRRNPITLTLKTRKKRVEKQNEESRTRDTRNQKFKSETINMHTTGITCQDATSS